MLVLTYVEEDTSILFSQKGLVMKEFCLMDITPNHCRTTFVILWKGIICRRYEAINARRAESHFSKMLNFSLVSQKFQQRLNLNFPAIFNIIYKQVISCWPFQIAREIQNKILRLLKYAQFWKIEIVSKLNFKYSVSSCLLKHYWRLWTKGILNEMHWQTW